VKGPPPRGASDVRRPALRQVEGSRLRSLVNGKDYGVGELSS
jgi:hypothetical protein